MVLSSGNSLTGLFAVFEHAAREVAEELEARAEARDGDKAEDTGDEVEDRPARRRTWFRRAR